MIQGSYEFLAIDKVHFGVPAAEAVRAETEARGARRVFVITTRSISRRTGVLDDIRAALGERFAGSFDDTVAHVPRASVMAALGAVRAAVPDLLLTVGGGTPIDTAKLVLACLAERITDAARLDAYAIRIEPDGRAVRPAIGRPPLRQIVLPTTLSGADFSDLGGCTDEARALKQMFRGRELGAAAVILDPRVTRHTPAWLWLSTGIRALDHAVESVCSTAGNPFTTATSLEALRLLGRSLPATKAAPDDLQPRLDSQLGVWLACTGLARVPWGASHGIGHQLGAVAGVPHGYCSCVLLPAVLRYNAAVNGERQHQVAAALGRPGASAAEAVAELVARLGLPGRLRDAGVRRDQFDAIARGSMENLFVSQNPRKISGSEDIVAILNDAW